MVKNVDKFQKWMRSIPGTINVEVEAQMEKEAEKVVRIMRAFAPKGVSRGLVESIGWTWGPPPEGTLAVGTVGEFDPLMHSVTVGADGSATVNDVQSSDDFYITIYAGGEDAFYARFQEFGTVKMNPNPFFFPAWRGERSRVKANIRRAVSRGVRKANSNR